jgi:hypothetical protein
MFTKALRRLVESACLKLPFYEVAGTIKLLRNASDSLCEAAKSKKNFESRISSRY